MKLIETIYAVMNEDHGEEAIVGIGSGGIPMQAVSSKRELTEKMLIFLKDRFPTRKFWIKKFNVVANDAKI